MNKATRKINAFILLTGAGISLAYAKGDPAQEIETRASLVEVAEESLYAPNSGNAYDGTPGWQVKRSEKPQSSRKNRNYEQEAEFYESCYPGESGTDCELKLQGKDQVGENRNYENDARYYGDCFAGESESECKTRQGQNTNYQNSAQYYGECNPEKEKCEGKGTNRNYQLNLDDFSGDGLDLYSGIPGGGQNNQGNFGGNQKSDLYRGIPGGSDNPADIRTNNGQSWYQSSPGSESGNYRYGSVDPSGSFSGYGSNEADWETIDNKRAEFDKGLDKEFNEEGLYKDKEKTNWMMTLVFCHLQIPFEGVHSVFSDKTCRKSIRKLCKFKVSRMKIYGPSQCVSFAPWKM